MSEQYPGGIITKTPVTPSGPYETSTASGIWTLTQQAYWQKQGLWPTAGNIAVTADPQFNYVTMLLHGDGANGAQNNTFIDSANANSITRVGNTTQGSFSSYGSNWSTLFDGTTQLSFSSNAGYAFGSGDFTVECWYYATSNPGYRSLIETRASNGTSTGWVLAADSGGAMYVYSSGFILTGITVVLNTWNHVAFTRSGSTQRLFLNGALVSSSTTSRTYSDQNLGVGGLSYSTGEYWTGYLSNVRMIKGTCLYTTTFTPPTTPLTAVSGTTLLTCQSNRWVDNSTISAPITAGTSANFAGASIQRFNPFGTSTAYSTSVIGGSGSFDGSGDYLNVTGANCALSGDFTVESWVYPTTWGGYQRIVSGGTSTFYWSLGFSTTWGGGLLINWYDGSDYYSTAYSPGSPLNTWYHLAVVRTGSTLYYYINGTRFGTTTSYTANPGNSSGGVTIGRRVGATEPWYGYITDTRVVIGTNVYGTGSTCTIPTAPLTSVSGTSVLVGYKNAGIFDNAMMDDYETAGNMQISTVIYKYGTGSLDFDGSGDYLLGKDSSLGNFGTGNFTVEYWDYHGTQGSANYACQVGNLSTATPSGTWRFGTFTNNGGVYFAYHNGSSYIDLQFGSTAYNDNTWRHFAVTRSGTTLRAFVNGVQVGTSQTVTQNFNTTNPIILGAEFVSPTYFDGYLDDVRITKGYARYTSNFTPPTVAFPNTGPT